MLRAHVDQFQVCHHNIQYYQEYVIAFFIRGKATLSGSA